MPNYVQLGQGLRDMGQSLSAGYDFINDQRQLDISQQNADTNSGQLKIQREQQDEARRLQRNKESNGVIVGEFQNMIGSGAASTTEYLGKNRQSLDNILNAWSSSNSRGRAAVGGKRITGILGEDGKFGIHTVESDGTTKPLAIDGQEYRVSGDDVYRMGLTEMAANGKFEVMSGLKALEANKPNMAPEEYTEKKQALVTRINDMQDAADKAGVDTNAIANDGDAATQRHAAIDSQQPPAAPAATAPAAPPPMLSATPAPQAAPKTVTLGDATVSRFFPTSVGAAPTPVLPVNPMGAAPTPVLPVNPMGATSPASFGGPQPAINAGQTATDNTTYQGKLALARANEEQRAKDRRALHNPAPSAAGTAPTGGVIGDAAASIAANDLTTRTAGGMLAEWNRKTPQTDLIDSPDVPGTVKLGAYINRAGRTIGAAVGPLVDDVSGAVKGFTGGTNNVIGGMTGEYKPSEAPKPAATPEAFIRNESKQPDQTPDTVIEKTQAQLTANPPRSEAHVKTIVKRGISTLSAPPKQESAGTGTRDAYVYSMGMIGMGLQPDKDVIGNLMAGDTFNGYKADKRKQDIDVWKEQNQNARFNASLDLQYSQLAVDEAKVRVMGEGNAAQRASAEKAETANIIAQQRHVIELKEKAIDSAAHAIVQPKFGKTGATDTKTEIERTKGQIDQELTLAAGQLASLGYNENMFYRQNMITSSAFIHQIALFKQQNDANKRHNASWASWYKGNNPNHSIGDGLLKFQQVHNPDAFQGTISELKQALGSDEYSTWQKENPGRKPSESEVTTLRTRVESKLAAKLNGLKDINLGSLSGVEE